MHAAWWWIDRWRKSTAYICMSLEEQGLYRNLLDAVWLFDGKPIPDEEKALVTASGGDAKAWAKHGARVLQWMQRVEGGWTNDTAVAVLTETRRVSEKRAAAGAKGAASRWQTHGNNDDNTHGKRDSKSNRKGHDKANAPSPSPSLKISDPNVTCSAADKPPTEPTAILVFPVTGNGANTWAFTAEQLTAWTTAYPALDVLAEVRKALVWIQANRRKTATGMPRFLVAWLNRATNSDTTTRAPLVQPPQRYVPFDADWQDDCRAHHNSECDGNRMRHYHRTQLDAAKAAKAGA